MPVLLNTGIKLLFCGPESFTPDHNYLMGEAPGLRNFFVAAGFNSLGILSGGGAGYVIAHWIAEGRPPMDVWTVNIRRMHEFQNDARYLAARTVESLGIGYQDHWPFRQWETARGVRKSPLHDRLAAAGACFGESAGWERANWFDVPGSSPQYRYSWGRQNWFERSAAEHRAVRERVGLFDQSSFAKFIVAGADATTVLNRIATAECDMPVGRVIYTQFLNRDGGIEADLTVTRLPDATHMVVTAAFTATHVGAWICDHVGEREDCRLLDVSHAYAMLNLQGPAARAVLTKICDSDCSNAAFPFGTCRELRIANVTLLALRISYVGELGWELYVPWSRALEVMDAIVKAGIEFDLKLCGYHALNSLRIEKAYREWAHDIGPDDNPIEAGLAFTCAWDKPGGFIGREAMLAKRASPLKRRLVQFLLEDDQPMMYHNEPIYRGEVRCGITTSGMFGHTLGAAVAMGYVVHEGGVTDDFIATGRFSVNIAGRRYPAIAALRPLYDPASDRVRS